jgi:cholesterol transport system auxiliary component
MNRPFRIAALLVAASLLAGCFSLGAGGGPEVSLRTIAEPAVATEGARADWHLLVDLPRAARPLNGPRIVLSPRPGEFGVLADVRWTDDAPRLVQALVVRAIERSGRVGAVAPVSSSVRADRLLELEIDAFHAAREPEGDAVRVAITARLIDARSNRIVATRRFETREPLESRRIDAVVGGFDRAVADVIPELVDWVASSGE